MTGRGAIDFKPPEYNAAFSESNCPLKAAVATDSGRGLTPAPAQAARSMSPSHSSTARPSRGPLPERAALMRPIAFAENWTCELSAARWARLPTPRICRIRPGLRRAAARPDRGRRLRRPATAYPQRKSSGRQPLTQGEHRHPLSFPQNHPEEGDGVLAVDVLEGRIPGGVVHVHAAALQGGQRLVGMTAGLAAAPGAGLA